MEYRLLIKELKNIGAKKVIVTGAQRSGTRFTANVLAKDLDVKIIDELDYGINNLKKFNKSILNLDGYSVQAPALSHLIEEFPDDAIIIFMYRPLNEILASQKRINWQSSTHEPAYINKYKKRYPKENINWNGRLAQVKKEVWEKVQQKKINNRWFNLEYSSLKNHPMWINKKERVNFKANQIK